MFSGIQLSNSKYFLLIAAMVCFMLSNCNRKQTVSTSPVAITDYVNSDITEDAIKYADSIVQRLDTMQKISQLIMPAVYSSSDKYNIERILQYAKINIGGIILLQGDIKSARMICDTLLDHSSIPPFIAIDAEWGLGMRFKDAPLFPKNYEFGNDTNEEDMFDYGREIAEECRKIGINMVLGPVLDISPVNGYIGKRSLGTDKTKVSNLSIAYAKGLESGNVISVAKHFPGHGAAKGDSHKCLPQIYRSLQSMDSIDLMPFIAYIKNDLSAIMVGHLAFPAIDPDASPAAVSKPVIQDLLRTDLGFNGLVLTDAMNMTGAKESGAEKAIEAGADIILAPNNTQKESVRIKKALENGNLTMAEIDQHLKRILIKKYYLNLEKIIRDKGNEVVCTEATKELQSRFEKLKKDSAK